MPRDPENLINISYGDSNRSPNDEHPLARRVTKEGRILSLAIINTGKHDLLVYPTENFNPKATEFDPDAEKLYRLELAFDEYERNVRSGMVPAMLGVLQVLTEWGGDEVRDSLIRDITLFQTDAKIGRPQFTAPDNSRFDKGTELDRARQMEIIHRNSVFFTATQLVSLYNSLKE